MTDTPLPPQVYVKYRVNWNIVGGGLGNDSQGNGTGNEAYPEDGYTEGYFNDITFKGGDVDFTSDGSFIKKVEGFRIEAFIEGGRATSTPGGPGEEFTWDPLSTELISLTITSSHESNDETWETDNPKLYGGVRLETTAPGTIGTQADPFTCGPDFDGEYVYEGETRISGYNYFKVFYDGEFSYIKRNSISLGFPDDAEIELDGGEVLPLTPFHADLKDPFGKDAPILPIDTITKFVPDDNESYEVTYVASIRVKYNNKVISLTNPTITVTQTVIQDLESLNFGEQLQALLLKCNFSYPIQYEISKYLQSDKLSEGYSANYPFTTVTHQPGERRENYEVDEGVIPTKRIVKNSDGEETEFPLEKGDVWYDPNTEIRQYYQINSFVKGVKILERGTIYSGPERPEDFGELLKTDESLMKGLDNLIGDSTEAINTYLENSNADQVRELLDGQDSFTSSYELATNTEIDRKRYNITTTTENPDSTGYGLTVDIVVNKKGIVKKAKVNKPGMYYTDGEIVLLEGGDCKIQVKVNDDEFWTEEFVSRYERPPNYWNNDISDQS